MFNLPCVVEYLMIDLNFVSENEVFCCVYI